MESSVRYLRQAYILWGNETRDENDDFTSQLVAPKDVSVDAVVTSLYLNTIAFVVLMASYECLRRLLPAVYSSRQRRVQCRRDSRTATEYNNNGSEESLTSLPNQYPFDWVLPVFSVSWPTIRKTAGLDGYFFLRYIRMCLRITAVSSFWAFAILIPIYATGANQNGAEGWYHYSVANVKAGSWRMWAPVVFFYYLTGFTAFVLKQEYRHYIELRMDFLGRGGNNVHPQHHYSLMIENIPYELRGDRALYEYFDKLFPGKIHSASVVLNLPMLESVFARSLRVCRRLEKSIAYFYATGRRPTHINGATRMHCGGVDLAPFDISCGGDNGIIVEEDGKPPRGVRVDSISYYTHDLSRCNQTLKQLQVEKTKLAERGNQKMHATNWVAKVLKLALEAADEIMTESAEANSLMPPATPDITYSMQWAERMTSGYGSFVPMSRSNINQVSSDDIVETSPPHVARRKITPVGSDDDSKQIRLVNEDHLEPLPSTAPSDMLGSSVWGQTPGTHQKEKEKGSLIRKIAGRLGLDFIVAGFKFFNRQLDDALEGIVVANMSSTGFVTFLDLASVSCAASAPLTHKPNVLQVSVAPEPREIHWKNAHVSRRTRVRREVITNIFLVAGVILWSFPLAAIQAFAKAEFIAQIPGLDWVLTFQGGSFRVFVNGYLPVMALLVLILVLPVIFEYIAVNYERRNTLSDIQGSMLDRYFYYQLANIYITVTAGSLWKSLADILDHPSALFPLLGESLPTMVGYFVSLLVTKILAGLPMIFLRFGALSRMLFLRALSSEDKLTQRELDEIYRPENVQYGWEFPSQLLVIVIVFTYAIICPVILPVGALFFFGSLIVYKKQVLYVYTPVYESGGALFPKAAQRTLVGLVCAQVTLIGYMVTRGFFVQPLSLLPLILVTLAVMKFFGRHYAQRSNLLSMERAMACDRFNEILSTKSEDSSGYGIRGRREQFDKQSYRQPVLSALGIEPNPYRRYRNDFLTAEAMTTLRRLQEKSQCECSSVADGGMEESDSIRERIDLECSRELSFDSDLL